MSNFFENSNFRPLDFLRQNPILFKGRVSRDFGGLQMILLDRILVPDVLLEVLFSFSYCFFNFLVFSGLSYY